MKVVAQNTDLRASLALPTVKKRIRMCGRPAVPNISAMPSEIAEIGLATAAPGSMILSCCGWTSIALTSRALKSKPNVASTPIAISGRADQQQRRLDDLHPGGGDHAAEGDIDDHQHADQDDGDEIGQTEQQLDELAGADHLRDQVEGDRDQRARRRHGADRRRLQTIGGDVGEGVAAEVAQRLGHQEHDDRPADEEADRVDQAVVAGAEHQRRNAEERGRRHVVAGDRQAVLEAGDAAAGGVEVLRRSGALRRPVGDAERQQDEDGEDADGVPIDRRGRGGVGGVGRAAGKRERRGEEARLDQTGHHFPPIAAALTIALVSSS